ncbi:asparaginase domain-containing protein [Aureimonas populi]|uniref:Asparaginase domain-containing protein n=1 Tax=Aureimonas populi TaxID=1701758 RepID=A0ABW5CQI7_9HYPH|nr:asparaginase domain-containing protein [Aureimonas populi]
MARIALLTTGGTIASSRAAGSDRVVANIAGEALRASLRSPLEGVDIKVKDFAFDLPLTFRLALRVNTILSAGTHDGDVVTHGKRC